MLILEHFSLEVAETWLSPKGFHSRSLLQSLRLNPVPVDLKPVLIHCNPESIGNAASLALSSVDVPGEHKVCSSWCGSRGRRAKPLPTAADLPPQGVLFPRPGVLSTFPSSPLQFSLLF